MPFFSIVARSASITLPRWHSAMNAATFGFDLAACAASGCSGATAQNVTPMIVSARVVNTYILPSPIEIAALVADVVREREAHALALADPVRLHLLHAIRPAGHLVEIREELVGVVGDAQVVRRDLALLDRRAGAPAATVDHLLVREHRLIDRIPVDDAGLLVRDALLEHLQEEPLVPLVVRGIAGGELARPVDRPAHRLALLLHVGDVLVRPSGGRHAVLHRRVFGGQSEGVPAHRHQHVVAVHPQMPVHHVVDRVVAHVPHVQLARRVRQHRHAIEFRPLAALGGAIGVGGAPLGLNGGFDFGGDVGFHRCGGSAKRAPKAAHERRIIRAGPRPHARIATAPDAGYDESNRLHRGLASTECGGEMPVHGRKGRCAGVRQPLPRRRCGARRGSEARLPAATHA